jgi:GAF domain-containing protein
VIREGVVSSVSLPLKAGEETVGVMFVNYRTHQAFDEEQNNLIESFSNLAAVAIHNARLWEAQKKQTKINEGIYAERSRQLNTIEGIVNAIGAPSDPLPIILQQVVGLFVSDYGAIGLFIPQTKEVKFYAIWEEGTLVTGDDIPADKRSISGKKSIMLHVAITGQAYRISDVGKDSHYRKWYSKTQSELAVPLKDSHGNVIGVLNLESTSLAAFTQTDEDLCQGLANVISSVTEKSNLLSTTQKLNRQLELLHSVVGEQDLQRVLTLILEGLNEIMGEGTSSSINLYDEESDSLYNVLATGELADNLRVSPRPGGTCRYVVSTREYLYVDDTQYELDNPPGRPTLRKEAVVESGIRSFAALPLIRNERVLGVLFVHQKNLTRFTQELQLVLDTFASQAAIAIDNARRVLDITALQEINEAIASKPLEEILNLVVAKAAQVIGAEYCSLWWWNLDSDDLVLRALHCPSEELESNYSMRLPAGIPSVNMEVYQSGKYVILADIEQSAGRYHRIYKPAHSELAVPMKFGGATIGTLNVESDRLNAFSEHSALILDTFADQAAIAIKLAQRMEEINAEVQKQTEEVRKRSEELFHMNYRLERRNASLEALTEIGQQLTAGIQYGEWQILSIIHQQASRIMDTNNMYVALYEPEKDLVHFELAFLDERSVDIKVEKGWEPRSGGQGRTEWIIRHKTPILTYTKTDAEQWYKQPETREYIGHPFASWLGVPIMFGDEVLGVIATYNITEEYKYDPDDLKILSLMGRQAAIALQNARLISKMDTVRELGEDLSSSLSI